MSLLFNIGSMWNSLKDKNVKESALPSASIDEHDSILSDESSHFQIVLTESCSYKDESVAESASEYFERTPPSAVSPTNEYDSKSTWSSTFNTLGSRSDEFVSPDSVESYDSVTNGPTFDLNMDGHSLCDIAEIKVHYRQNDQRALNNRLYSLERKAYRLSSEERLKFDDRFEFISPRDYDWDWNKAPVLKQMKPNEAYVTKRKTPKKTPCSRFLEKTKNVSSEVAKRENFSAESTLSSLFELKFKDSPSSQILRKHLSPTVLEKLSPAVRGQNADIALNRNSKDVYQLIY